MTSTAPGLRELGPYRLAINKNAAVVIWCSYHQQWIPAANASRHFSTYQGRPSLGHLDDAMDLRP